MIRDLDKVKEYLKNYLLNKKIYLKFDKNYVANKDFVEAYVYLKNKIFINAFLIKNGLAFTDMKSNYDLKKRFIKLEDDYKKLVSTNLLEENKTKASL